jgi:hypothetical protein
VRAGLVVACALATAAPAAAAPVADVVIVWTAEPAPALTAAIGDAARRADAALIDVSPAVEERPDLRPLVTRGIDAYGALELENALTALDAAADQVDRTGAAGLDPASLGDLFLYRGLIHAHRGDDARAWDDFVIAATIAPTRVLDPARFPPRAIEQHGRALAAVATRARGTVTLAPAACSIRIDGAAVTTVSIELAFGVHWLRAECAGHAATGRRFEVDRGELAVEVAGPALAPPTDDELVIQGRSAGARAVVAVTIRGEIALVRRLGIDGREQDRASVATGGADAADRIGDAVTRLVAARVATPSRRRWYHSGWVWAAAGALVASAILVPIALSDRGGTAAVVVRPEGVPAW